MKTISVLFSVLILAAGTALAIPSEITYQGTLREKGIPTTGTKTMNFSIYNKGANTPLWSSGPRSVNVKAGLFSTQLSPTGIDWQTVTPELEVVVEGVALTPREPITATIYANVAGSVTNGSIKLNSLASEVVTVPTGAILMFAGPCPTGWTRFTALDNRFPMGANLYGSTGGAASHNHTISADGAHSHSVPGIVAQPGNSPTSGWVLNNTPTGWAPYSPPSRTDEYPNHSHGGSTGTTSNLPPFSSVVFCQKI